VLQRCPRCAAPEVACFCAHLQRTPSRVPVVLVRHIREAHKGSNTGRIAAEVLGIPLFDHGGAERVVLAGLGASPALLFPHGETGAWRPPSALVVIDATWHQARNMRARLPELQGLPTLSLGPPPAIVRMRAQRREDGMSTIEAIAGALERLDDPEPARALRAAHAAMTACWLALRQHPSVRPG
jgi:DTW domain-containing protein YfiP